MITERLVAATTAPLASGINWEFIALLTAAAVVSIAVAWLYSSSAGGSE